MKPVGVEDPPVWGKQTFQKRPIPTHGETVLLPRFEPGQGAGLARARTPATSVSPNGTSWHQCHLALNQVSTPSNVRARVLTCPGGGWNPRVAGPYQDPACAGSVRAGDLIARTPGRPGLEVARVMASGVTPGTRSSRMAPFTWFVTRLRRRVSDAGHQMRPRPAVRSTAANPRQRTRPRVRDSLPAVQGIVHEAPACSKPKNGTGKKYSE